MVANIYQTALADIAANTQKSNTRRKQNNANMGMVLDLLDQQDAAAAMEKILSTAGKKNASAGRDSSGSQVFRDRGGQTLPTGSKGPSSGSNAGVKLKTWNWHGKSITSERGSTTRSFRGLLNDLAAEGYKISSAASYSNRNARGSNRLSEHAFGRAIDINPSQNPMTSNSGFRTNMPDNVNQIAAENGLVWGGSWHGKKDPMHFSTTGW